jgi:hypothetical protein
MEAIKTVDLLIRFLLELCILLIFGYWGFKTGSQGLSKVFLGVGVPLASAVIWGTFFCPQSRLAIVTTLAAHSGGHDLWADNLGTIQHWEYLSCYDIWFDIHD